MIKNRKLRGLFAGGGTGGHLFPAVAVAEAILQQHLDADLRFIGTAKGIENRILPARGFHLYRISSSGIYRVGLWRKLLGLARIPLGLVYCLWIILVFRPHFVLGVGGYSSGPALIAALLLFRKTYLQEQNSSPGMTNRILGKYVRQAFVPFRPKERLYRNYKIVGNPIRGEIAELFSREKATYPRVEKGNNTFSILVLGGSRGAVKINRLIAEVLPLLAAYRDRVSVTHQVGELDFETASQANAATGMDNVRTVAFIEDMKSEYAKADLIISRAGSVVYEFIAAGCPSILIPIPWASGDHQKQNALVLTDHGAALMIEETEVTPERLAGEIIQLLKKPERLREMSQRCKELYKGNGADMIRDSILAQI